MTSTSNLRSVRIGIRGIGKDFTPGCFVCGGDEGCYHNIAAFVSYREDGERAVALFAQGARLDYRENEPNWIQLKIGACDKHLPNLQSLEEKVSSNNGLLSPDLIVEASSL